MGRFEGKVAIVTGGAQGIGGATARRLAEDGARVLIADVDDSAAAANVARIASEGGTAIALRTDVSDSAQIKAMVERAVTEWGRLDFLVNNAYGSVGINVAGSALEVSEEAWDKGVALLIKPIFLAVKHAVPHMERVGGGAIVNISSVHGMLMAPGRLVYEAGKSAVIGVTRQMATDFGPKGIRVNAICPGHIVTERMARRWGDNVEGLKFFDQQYPVRRTGVPRDIANAAAFLCSEDASFITGVTLPVDGGLTIQLQEDLGVHLAKWARENPGAQMPY